MTAASTPQTALSDLRAGRLRGATRLDLRHAGLTEFPDEIFTLAETLESLDLSGNDLQALPDDLARLHCLRTLFCSNNRFTELPPELGRCRQLDIVGFKANRIERVDASAIAPSLRWLILTDNCIPALPESVGDCTRMQKLMLAGNRLRSLPARLAECRNLELLRIAANEFQQAGDALPDTLLALPRLAWLAFSGNPFSAAREAAAAQASTTPSIAWEDLTTGELLGEGASGWIHAAQWQPDGATLPQAMAIKRFKGAVTSDGLPASEMAACIAAGTHAHIVGVEGRLAGHPQAAQGLVMRRIPAGFRNLAGPPSLASCTRDVYADGRWFTVAQARTIARSITDALAHLHARGLVHGDLYAHNILVDDDGHALLGDFGAASFVPDDDAHEGRLAGGTTRADALRRLDRRALGHLVDELAQRCEDPRALDDFRHDPASTVRPPVARIGPN